MSTPAWNWGNLLLRAKSRLTAKGPEFQPDIKISLGITSGSGTLLYGLWRIKGKILPFNNAETIFLRLKLFIS